MKLKNRRELTQYLEDRLTKTYERLKEGKELEQSLLKTYIIESNLPAISNIPVVSGYSRDILTTEDNTLFILNVHNKRGRATFYIDTLNPRFWFFHTVNKSEFTDSFINKFVTSPVNRLDFPWFPIQFLEERGREERFRGFSLRYDDKFIEGDEDVVPIKTLSMKLWGNTAPKVLDILRQDSELKHAIALSGVGIKHFINHEDYVINDITFQGKFTARGTSIDSHFYVLQKVQKTYEEKVNLIEDNSITISSTEMGFKFSGQPMAIMLKKEIEDLKSFLDQLLSSKSPFRLWGVSKFLEKDFVKINAVDLHTGHELNLEAAPEWIRIYLPQGSCGNTVLRLLTNIQHYYDSDAILEGGENERII